MDALALINRVAGLIASLLLSKASRYTDPRVLLDDGVPRTNGQTVYLPRKFLGFDLLEDAWVGVALLAHEFGHWLQPLDQITQVKWETGLDHNIVNLLLDIQNDAMIASASPMFGAPLARLRKAVAAQENLENLKKAARSGDPFQSGYAALFCNRFEIGLGLITGPDNWFDIQDAANEFTYFVPTDLPEKLRQFALKFPQFCRPSPSKTRSGHASQAQTECDEQAEGDSVTGTSKLKEGVQQSRLEGFIPPSREVEADAARIAPRWMNHQVGSVMGPGRFDHMAALRQEPMPFSQPSGKGKQKSPPRLVLALDISNSMKGHKWEKSLVAGQVVQRAIEKAAPNGFNGLEILFFTEDLFKPANPGHKGLFSRSLNGRSLNSLPGGGTSFAWLSGIWLEHPEHHVVIVTDGDGPPPLVVSQSCRQRTTVIAIDSGSPTPWAAHRIDISSDSSSLSTLASLIVVAADRQR